MIKRWILFGIGMLLLLPSLPLGTKMIMEIIHDQRMDSRYTITNLNQGYPATPSVYHFNEHEIEIKETLLDGDHYIDPWENRVGLADLSLHVNGKEVDQLEGYPVRLEQAGLSRYWGEISYVRVLDEKNNETSLYILLKKTKEIVKEKPNGDIIGYSPDEQLQYTFHRIDEKGNISSESFYFPERNALQIKLLNAGYLYHHKLGFHTDAWHWYPSLFFPFIYPFFMLIAGIFLTIFFFPIRSRNRKYKSSGRTNGIS